MRFRNKTLLVVYLSSVRWTTPPSHHRAVAVAVCTAVEVVPVSLLLRTADSLFSAPTTLLAPTNERLGQALSKTYLVYLRRDRVDAGQLTPTPVES